MNFYGLIIGAATFLLIGCFHVIVVKAEYYFSKNIWPLFLIVGTAALALSLFTANSIISGLIAVFGISCLWSIKELIEQEERVKKGWFPKNPNRK
nr:DUF4491 family protein [uncultured Catonella sp.]